MSFSTWSAVLIIGVMLNCLSLTIEEEKSFNLLVARVACFGKLRHKPIGYSGPLSHQLLSYHSLIYALRSTLRNLIEVVLAGLLLNGEVDRDRDDWSGLSLR